MGGGRWGGPEFEKQPRKTERRGERRRVREEEERREERKVYSLGQAVKTGAECSP